MFKSTLKWIDQLAARYFHYREEMGAAELGSIKKPKPLQWGLDAVSLKDSKDPKQALLKFVAEALEKGPEYYRPNVHVKIQVKGNDITFRSGIQTGESENDLVHARFFPSKSATTNKTAVILLPWWNAKSSEVDPLAKFLSTCGLSTARLTLPYHAERRPKKMSYAEYFLCSNVGVTLRSTRQSIWDVIHLIDHLETQGFEKFGILGLSVGSFVGAAAACLEPRVQSAVLNLIGSDIAKAAWHGVATRHLREGMEPSISLSDLQKIWQLIDPSEFLRLRNKNPFQQLVISTRYDQVVDPHLTHDYIAKSRQQNIPTKVIELPCGHYTLGSIPFKWIVGVASMKFLRESLLLH